MFLGESVLAQTRVFTITDFNATFLLQQVLAQLESVGYQTLKQILGLTVSQYGIDDV